MGTFLTTILRRTLYTVTQNPSHNRTSMSRKRLTLSLLAKPTSMFSTLGVSVLLEGTEDSIRATAFPISSMPVPMARFTTLSPSNGTTKEPPSLTRNSTRTSPH